jgi:hypothetical protein
MFQRLFIRALLAGLLAGLCAAPVVAEPLTDKLISKGGILYPRTGDYTQDRYQTPPNVMEFIRPGMLIGILPDDCTMAQNPQFGKHYACDYGLALKPVSAYGHPAYEVLDK